MSRMTKKYEGFTLVEILVVVGLIAILALVTLVALNPTRQFANTRNAARSADVNAILNAVSQYLSTEGNTIGSLQTAAGGNAIPTCPTTAEIGQDTGNTSTTEINLDGALVDEFIAGIPQDAQTGDADDTGYTICQSNGRVTISAPGAELGSTISVTR